MDVGQLQNQFKEHLASMYHGGDLDDQFSELLKLQDDTNPNFVLEVVSLFFKDSEKLLKNLTNATQLPIVDFRVIAENVHQFKGSSASIGVQKVKNLCVAFKNFCDKNDRDGCVNCLNMLTRDYNVAKTKLNHLLLLQKRIMAAGGKLPVMG